MVKAAVLVVEDEPLMLVALARHVATNGFEPIPCARYGEAVGAIEACHGDLFAVIADYSLDPAGNGIDVIGVARERAGLIPAMLLTGWRSVPLESVIAYHSLGPGVDVRSKPFDGGVIRGFLELARASPRIDPDPLDMAAAIRALGDQAGLTDPERQLLPLIAEDLSRTEMALHLRAPDSTVHTRVGRVLAKAATALGDPSIGTTRALRAVLRQHARALGKTKT